MVGLVAYASPASAGQLRYQCVLPSGYTFITNTAGAKAHYARYGAPYLCTCVGYW